MPTTFTIDANCKTLNIIGGPADAEYTLFHNDFLTPTSLYQLQDPTIPYNGNLDPVTGEPINGYEPFTPATLNGAGSATLSYQNIASASEESLNGVFMLSITDPSNDNIASVYGAIGYCDIDCCINSKLETLLDCSCDQECSSYLDTISKIYLLLKGSEVNVLDCIQSSEQYQRAYIKYAKAKTMCSASECNCNC